MKRSGDSTFSMLTSTKTDSLTALGPIISRLPRLIVLHSPNRSALGRLVVVEPEGDPVLIGRRGGDDLVLELADSALSRRHSRIEHRGGAEAFIIDMGSHNGTFVDGVRVEGETPLQPGAVIRLGGTLLLYEVAEVKQTDSLQPAKAPLYGPSLAMQQVRGAIEIAAPDSGSVLITGESGVGKELVAREIHRASGRKGDLVATNCGALPSELVEAELFGSIAGAYTGSTGTREGLFRAADGGTLLLDEIGELPLTLQPKILRALSSGEVRPIGATMSEAVDVRVVAATNRDLAALVEAGTFRGDLLSRLQAWIIEVPPLRDRKEDILAIVRDLDSLPKRVTADAAEAFLLHDWPYNVRELIQTASAAWIRSGREDPLTAESLPDELIEPIAARRGVRRQIAPAPLALRVRPDQDPDEQALRTCLEHFGGKVSAVADYFDRRRFQIYRWCDRYDINVDDYRPK